MTPDGRTGAGAGHRHVVRDVAQHQLCHGTAAPKARLREVQKQSQGDIVQTAEVRIADEENFGGRLTDMRLWLDERRFEPSSFTYFYLDPGMMIRVAFSIDDEAEAFAHEFGGFVVTARRPAELLAV
jgi:hypothetical protein